MFPEDRWGSRCTTAEEGGHGFGRRGLVAGEGVVSTEQEGASGLGCWGAEAQGRRGRPGPRPRGRLPFRKNEVQLRDGLGRGAGDVHHIHILQRS